MLHACNVIILRIHVSLVSLLTLNKYMTYIATSRQNLVMVMTTTHIMIMTHMMMMMTTTHMVMMMMMMMTTLMMMMMMLRDIKIKRVTVTHRHSLSH